MGGYCYYDPDLDDVICLPAPDTTDPPQESPPSPNVDAFPVPDSPDPEIVTPDSTLASGPVDPTSTVDGSINDRSAGASDGDVPLDVSNSPPASSPFSLFSDAEPTSPYFLIDPNQISQLGDQIPELMADATGYYGIESALWILVTGKDKLTDFLPSEEGCWWGLTTGAVFGAIGAVVGFPEASIPLGAELGETGFDLGMQAHEFYEDVLTRGSAVDSILHYWDEIRTVPEGAMPTPAPGPTPSPPSEGQGYNNCPDMICPNVNRLK